MNAECRKVQRIYLTLELLHTLAASFIWGINTLFLLDAGLSNAEAFAANAFFTAGLVLFEVPTGVVADTRGRRTSYLLGTLTLAASTLLYLWMWRISAPLWAWALASALLGLGFTFFSGAVEAWLVDALAYSGFDGKLESVFAKGEIVQGIAMLGGSVAGGAIAQATNLGVPYVLRVIVLALTFLCAFAWLRDLGFTPSRGKRPLVEVKRVLRGSVEHGLANPPVRWVMLAGLFSGGVMIYAFYAMQPYLLELYGDEEAYGIAGLAAAIVAGAQILGGLSVSFVGRVFRRRTTVLLGGRRCQLRHPGDDRARARVLAGSRVAGPVGSALRGGLTRPTGVSERSRPLRPARHRPVLRLHAGVDRWGRRPAGARSRGRRLELPGLLCRGRGNRRAGASIPLAGAQRARSRRCDPRRVRTRAPAWQMSTQSVVLRRRPQSSSSNRTSNARSPEPSATPSPSARTARPSVNAAASSASV